MSLINQVIMNNFGGNWTYKKIKIIEDYAKAYLQIMKDRPYWKLLYFDGFAGSGEIRIDGSLDSNVIDGAAKKIVALKEPKMFDICYFVELDKQKAKNLQDSLHQIRKELDGTTVKISSEIVIDYLKRFETFTRSCHNINQLAGDKSLIMSHVHMFVNRLFSHNQRLEELVIYFCLEKYSIYKLNKNGVKK